jgi:EAL domain-containing protein (putative c-di-GMP-specific phosphodiesterase class I)
VAKKRGKNQVYIFRKQDYHKYMRKRSILRAVRRSVANNFIGFRLLFQPIVSAGTQQLFAAESLLRFQMPDGECIFPEEFLPVLEESGLMIPVGKWVLEQAIDMCLAAQKKLPEFRISVNLSGVQILKSAIVEDINQRISSYGIEPQSMIFELAESGYPENTQSLREVWEQLRSYGVFIAMDDFGAGYSNLQSIGKMTPHIVKLDRRFVRKALEQEYEERGMNYVIDMVHSLGLKICVVGIETKEELQKVCEMSPDYIQGYYYGKPCTREEFIEKIS